MIEVTIRENNLVLPLRVTPRGGKDAFLPFQPGDEWIRLKVSAPPEDGKANAAVLALFAKSLKLPKSAVTLVSGETSRLKRIQIIAPDTKALLETLAILLSSEPALCFQV